MGGGGDVGGRAQEAGCIIQARPKDSRGQDWMALGHQDSSVAVNLMGKGIWCRDACL